MPAIESDSKTCLRAFRKGNFAALLIARDAWQDAGNAKLVAEFDRVECDCRFWIKHPKRVRVMGLAEAMRRTLRDFVFKINRKEKVWRLPKSWHYIDMLPDAPVSIWIREMSWQFILWVRSQQPTESEHENGWPLIRNF